MNDLSKNKLFWVALVLGGVLLFVGVGGNKIVDKIANRVIQKLQKDYSPSPYGPGIDPDKLDVQRMQGAPPAAKKTSLSNEWENGWEKERK